ncbi:hypothetical protein ACFCWG_26035, partial [Streptomyces sp. NPDC056390]|uniref:hypothetical protein n=1 Tax=Streptomyces sp. NPDC056390 TaxID=3345806 RepID=UPI0035D90613
MRPIRPHCLLALKFSKLGILAGLGIMALLASLLISGAGMASAQGTWSGQSKPAVLTDERCGTGFVLDKVTKKCGKEEPGAECPEGRVWDFGSNKCVDEPNV